jgi:hypothetical protein
MSRESAIIEARDGGPKLADTPPCAPDFGQAERMLGLKNAMISSALSPAS